mmetsp:Transcript_60567/g.177634  ORF Transcript_60567/g.177634 Transcript_60567/m.177634 type:complete len:493 (-) Transcript_60567:69-1547(-)
MLDRDGRALFSALQHKEGIDVIRPLVTPERAALKDPYYRLKPLFWALSYGASPEVVKTLLSAHPEAANEKHPTEGWTPLHYVERLDPETVQLLLERCPGAVKEQDAGGELPLHWAAEHGALEAARLLLQAYPDGAQVEDHLGRLPVRMAADGEVGEDLLEVLREATPGAAAALPAAPIQEPLPIGLLFPGQGSQYVRMLESAQGIPAVQAMLAEAQDILGYDLLKVCLEGPAEKLADTLYCQPVMYVAGLAALEQLRLEKPDVAARPKSMAGLSLGEYTALTAAGVFSFADGLSLVKARAEAMSEASNATPQAMLSVAGLDEKKLLKFCEEALRGGGPDEVCQISNYLFTKGYTVGGTKAAVERCRALCENGKALQARLIKASGAYHTPLMTPARERLEAKLQEVLPRMSRPRCKVVLNVDAKVVDWNSEPQQIADALLRQLTSTVRWKDCVVAMIGDGCEEFYECGPMKQLKAMMKRIDANVWQKTTNIEV